jgi:hypothetical protein
LSRRRELISSVIRQRLGEVCAAIVALPPVDSSDPFEFTTRVKQLFQPGNAPRFTRWAIADAWRASDLDCLTALRALAVDEPISSTQGQTTSPAEFLRKLKETRNDEQLQFELLTIRYRFPLNFLLPSERLVSEYLLERLMVQERARIEQSSVEAVSADALLLKLSLVAIHASCTTDLRFLDALNYYYELLPSTWQPQSRHEWLPISFLAFYARALSWYC